MTEHIAGIYLIRICFQSRHIIFPENSQQRELLPHLTAFPFNPLCNWAECGNRMRNKGSKNMALFDTPQYCCLSLHFHQAQKAKNMDSNTLIEIDAAVPRFDAYKFRHPITWNIGKGENWTLIDPNGAGKTQLVSIMLEQQALLSGKVRNSMGERTSTIAKYVAFTDIYTIFDAGNSYYQQRWNTGDIQTAPFVDELFEGITDQTTERFMEIFHIGSLMGKRVNMLSSGELRKTLIVLALRSEPRLLILDNPYIGLDAGSREVLEDVFRLITEQCGIQLMTLVADPRDIPQVTSHVLPIKDKTLLPAMSRKDFLADREMFTKLFGYNEKPTIPHHASNQRAEFETILDFKNIKIQYGEKVILNGIDWKIKRGEKWLLSGKNGSGKSTLLSLVFCDNPQGYANDISLFDRKHGPGQSIWDVKRRIGYISPEITNYYRKHVSCLDVVASGFSDTIGIPYDYSDEKKETALQWMSAFGIEHLAEKSSVTVSAGEHQMVMLARAFVKDPDLLILDEPMHGLDIHNKARVRQIIKEWATEEKSLIYVTHYEEEAPEIITDKLDLNSVNKK